MTERACRSEAAILDATLDLLASEGFAGLTVDAVAARAGVGKATIYRHWRSRARLVYDAASRLHATVPEPDRGSLREDLTVLLRQLVAVLDDPASGRVLTSMLDAAERDEELAGLREGYIEERRAVFERAFQRAVARGELGSDVELRRAVDLTVGPLFYKRLVSRSGVRRSDVAPHVELVLRALGVDGRLPG